MVAHKYLAANINRLSSFFIFVLISLFLSCDTQDTLDLTFVEVQGQQDFSIDKIQFIDDNRAYAVGGDLWQFGIAQFTSDGGDSWSLDTISFKTVRDFDFDRGSIYAAGYRGYYISTDTSINDWNLQRPDDRENIHGIVHQEEVYTAVGGISFQHGFIKQLDKDQQVISIWDTPGEMTAIIKTADQTLHAVGYGQIYRSLDNGQNWLANAQEGDNYQDVYFLSNNIGWIVGQAGSILKTEDAGNTWQELRKPQAHGKANLLNIHFANEDLGVLVGEEGIVWTSNDGGQTWSVVESLPAYNYTSVFVKDDVAWLGSEEGHLLKMFF